MNNLLRIMVLCAPIFSFNHPLCAGALKASISGQIYDWSRPKSSSITHYGVSFKNKSNQDIFLVVENNSARTSQAKFGSLRYFTTTYGKSLATTPVFKLGSAISREQAKKQKLNVYDEDGNYIGQYWEGVNLELDINQATKIAIYSYDRNISATGLPHTSTVKFNDITEFQRYFLPNAKLLYYATFTPGKTIYVKWDGKKLSPQNGNIAGKSDGGFSLKNNVTTKDIISVR